MRAYDNTYIDIATEAAMKSDCKMKMGACIVSNKKVLSSACNRWFGLSKVLTKYGMLWSLHAEMAALSKVPYGSAYGSTIYISRKGKKLAKPCIRCENILFKAGIDRVVYTDGIGIKELW